MNQPNATAVSGLARHRAHGAAPPPSPARSLSVLERPLGQHTEGTIRVAGGNEDVIVKVAGDQVGANALGRQGSRDSGSQPDRLQTRMDRERDASHHGLKAVTLSFCACSRDDECEPLSFDHRCNGLKVRVVSVPGRREGAEHELTLEQNGSQLAEQGL